MNIIAWGLISILSLWSVPTSAQDAALKIAVGQPERGYESRGKEIVTRLKRGEVVNYEGSADISKAVCSGEAQVGIMQIDAVYMRKKEGCTLQVVAKYGDEYAFLLFPPNSDMDKLTDLNASSRILVDTVGSGTDLFFHNIKVIEKQHGRGTAWSDAKAVNGFIFMADGMAAAGDIDAVLIVGNPNSKEVTDLIDAGWDAGELRDRDIDDEVFNRRPLYTRESVKIGHTGFMRGNSESAYVVPSFVVVNKDWIVQNRDMFQRVARAVMETS